MVSVIASTLPASEDMCWVGPDKIVSSNGQQLQFLNLKKSKAWTEVDIKQGKELLKGVTRIAVNEKRNKLAVVISE